MMDKNKFLNYKIGSVFIISGRNEFGIRAKSYAIKTNYNTISVIYPFDRCMNNLTFEDIEYYHYSFRKKILKLSKRKYNKLINILDNHWGWLDDSITKLYI